MIYCFSTVNIYVVVEQLLIRGATVNGMPEWKLCNTSILASVSIKHGLNHLRQSTALDMQTENPVF